MGIYVGDIIETPEGPSLVEKISAKKINQYAHYLVFAFANGYGAKIKRVDLRPWNESDVIFDSCPDNHNC